MTLWYHRERNCVDTIGTVLVHRIDHSHGINIEYFKEKKSAAAILSNGTQKLLRFYLTYTSNVAF